MRVDSRELPLSAIPLSATSMSSWASQAHAFHQPVFYRLSLLHHWSIPHVHTSRAFSPPEWGPDPQYQAAQVTHWTWWWQCLVAWHCRSVWSLPCHSSADNGGLALSMAKSHWHGALCSTHKSCTCSHVSWKRGGEKRDLVQLLQHLPSRIRTNCQYPFERKPHVKSGENCSGCFREKDI